MQKQKGCFIMARLFNEHIVRPVHSLDGAWRFCVDREDKGEAEGWEKGIPATATVAVPSVWNCESGLLEYEGTRTSILPALPHSMQV